MEKQSVEPSHLEQFLDDYLHCCLCGTELSYTHVTNFVTLEVAEEARCPSCQIRHKKDAHTLQ